MRCTCTSILSRISIHCHIVFLLPKGSVMFELYMSTFVLRVILILGVLYHPKPGPLVHIDLFDPMARDVSGELANCRLFPKCCCSGCQVIHLLMVFGHSHQPVSIRVLVKPWRIALFLCFNMISFLARQLNLFNPT